MPQEEEEEEVRSEGEHSPARKRLRPQTERYKARHAASYSKHAVMRTLNIAMFCIILFAALLPNGIVIIRFDLIALYFNAFMGRAGTWFLCNNATNNSSECEHMTESAE